MLVGLPLSITSYLNLHNGGIIVKKIKLLPTQADHKIFREVNALSRLTHRFIVRYFTTWLEETETASNTTSSSGSETGSESNSTSVPTDEFTTSAIFSIDLDDMASTPQANEENSFPSVMFQNSNSGSNDQDDDDDDGDSDDDGPAMLKPGHPSRKAMVTPPPLQWKSRTLYIQMVCFTLNPNDPVVDSLFLP